MSNFSSEDDGLQHPTTHQTDEASHMEYTEYQVAQILWKTCPPCIFLLGGFGNIATICVMLRTKDHNSSQHAILMALAISDLTLLCTELSRVWVWYVFQVNLEILHVATCKVPFFLVYASNATSAWLVTCVTVQRTMAVLWPHRMRVMCTVRRTWIVIATLVLSACALNFHFLIGFDIIAEDECFAMAGVYHHFFTLVFSWVDLCLASLFPSVCLIVCDVILSVSLFKAVSSASVAARVESTVNTAHSTDSRRRKTSYRTTVMVLAISCSFLVLTLPVCVRIVWYYYNQQTIAKQPKTLAIDELLNAVTQLLWLTNSAINFVLYCLTGTKFRREFVNWIRCGAQSPSAPSVYETASEASREGRHQHQGNNPLSK